MWRVLVVEDDPTQREFFSRCVQRCAELELAGSVGSVADALQWLDACERSPDVLLADLGLPDGSGLQVIRHARVQHPECEALVISMFGDEENVLASIEAGALGYIHKDAAPDDIAHTILEMKAGASPISPMVARRVLSKYFDMHVQNFDLPAGSGAGLALPVDAGTQAGEDAVSALSVLLSVREQDVLELIARGFSYADISRLSEISVHTVQSHIKSLYRKLAVHSRSQAVFEATRLGLLPDRA